MENFDPDFQGNQSTLATRFHSIPHCRLPWVSLSSSLIRENKNWVLLNKTNTLPAEGQTLTVNLCLESNPKEGSSVNEDHAFAFIANARIFLGVFDGIGGHLCGEMASRLARDTLKEYFEHTMIPDDLDPSFQKYLRKAVILSSRKIEILNQTITSVLMNAGEYSSVPLGAGAKNILSCCEGNSELERWEKLKSKILLDEEHLLLRKIKVLLKEEPFKKYLSEFSLNDSKLQAWAKIHAGVMKPDIRFITLLSLLESNQCTHTLKNAFESSLSIIVEKMNAMNQMILEISRNNSSFESMEVELERNFSFLMILLNQIKIPIPLLKSESVDDSIMVMNYSHDFENWNKQLMEWKSVLELSQDKVPNVSPKLKTLATQMSDLSFHPHSPLFILRSLLIGSSDAYRPQMLEFFHRLNTERKSGTTVSLRVLTPFLSSDGTNTVHDTTLSLGDSLSCVCVVPNAEEIPPLVRFTYREPMPGGLSFGEYLPFPNRYNPSDIKITTHSHENVRKIFATLDSDGSWKQLGSPSQFLDFIQPDIQQALLKDQYGSPLITLPDLSQNDDATRAQVLIVWKPEGNETVLN